MLPASAAVDRDEAGGWRPSTQERAKNELGNLEGNSDSQHDSSLFAGFLEEPYFYHLISDWRIIENGFCCERWVIVFFVSEMDILGISLERKMQCDLKLRF